MATNNPEKQASLWAECKRQVDALWAEYNQKVGALWAEYDRQVDALSWPDQAGQEGNDDDRSNRSIRGS